MSRGKTLILLAVAGALIASPAAAGDEPAIPQRDPRDLSYEEPLHQRLARVGEALYLATRAFDCQRLEPVDPDDEICVWGPITLAALHDDPTGPPFIPGVPLVTKFAAPESFDGEITTLVASGRSDGVVLVAGIGETELIVSEIPTDGSAPTTRVYDVVCDGHAAFDAVDPFLWFSCGPIALNYQTGSQILFSEAYELVVAHPGGGVAGLVGGDIPTVGVFNTSSGDLFMPKEIPVGATGTSAVADAARGVGIVFETPCADPCQAVPAEPAPYPNVSPPFVDLWVVWVGWDGVVDADFGVVSLGTGPPGRSFIATDGDVTVVSLPIRIPDDPSPDAGFELWRLVGADGTVDPDFGADAGDRLLGANDLHMVWGGVVDLRSLDHVAAVTFWHLTDQGRFFDDAGLFEEDIEALASAGVTLGCNADGTLFCPDEPVTRGQMASFIARWLSLELDKPDLFGDDDGSMHESSINAIADAGITLGCSTADPTLFCPDQLVTRGQMASFIARALGFAPDLTNRFTDDDGSAHEASIDAIATAGITLGCDAVDPNLYCPLDSVLRRHMAAFLVRASV